MIKSFILIGLMLSSTQLFAFECNPSGNQGQMNQCAEDEWKEADKALNKTYEALIKKAKGNQLYIMKLRKSQRLWIRFRDAELDMIFPCDHEDRQRCWGSMVGMLYPRAKKELTLERTHRLEHYFTKSHHYWVGDEEDSNPY